MSPLRGCVLCCIVPTAYAVGLILAAYAVGLILAAYAVGFILTAYAQGFIRTRYCAAASVLTACTVAFKSACSCA